MMRAGKEDGRRQYRQATPLSYRAVSIKANYCMKTK